MYVERLPDAEAVAKRGAAIIAERARLAVAERSQFVLAVSGGKTPWVMLRHLADEDMPWDRSHIVQVDERIAPEGDPDRNLTNLRMSLHSVPNVTIVPMPVNAADLEHAAAEYAATLEQLCGSVIDLVHLGMGPDGHTASLVPGDLALDAHDRDVTLTGVYQGRRRMTLTYPILNRARGVLWIVTGAEKAGRLEQLLKGDTSIPAGRIESENAVIVTEIQ